MTRSEDSVDAAGTTPTDAAPAGQSSRYRAYLVRCWREGDAWRFSLESVGASDVRRGFNRLEDLMAHVQTDLAQLHAEAGAKDEA